MRRRRFGAVLAVVVLAAAPGTGRAQGLPAAPLTLRPATAAPAYAAPGGYGMMYGTPSYGSVRTSSAFASPFGTGYGYGYPAYRILPGPYGVGVWRPAMASPGDAYGASYRSYRTFPVPYDPRGATPTPPVGVYAPGFGPPVMIGD